ncbi:MAG: hypothetical protein COA82_12305 [Alkaliphilus sp.]|nr:hypothetical protein [Alkaliphilus transvaalensis]MBN4069885.1 hypothetical protein [bacterium AH-315-G05]PHS29777.1 MAG: hypothetical protein COA82_12305 [Alkaliphilus sp.]
MDRTARHIDLEALNEFFDETKQNLGILKGLSAGNNESFFEKRINYLDKYLDELEEKKKELERKLASDIQRLIADRGAEILSIKQIIRFAAKECGVCENRLETLREQLKNEEAKNV